MTTNLKITVITSAYNCEESIIKCIESVANQNYANYEHIIINDGSTDNTDKVIRDYLHEHSNNIIYLFQNNCGVSSARNYGLRSSSGDLITFLDSDDYYDIGFFDSIVKNICDNDILLYGYKTVFDGKCNIMRYGCNLSGEKDFIFRELSKYNLFNPVCNKVYKSKLIENIYFDETLDIGEDFLFFTVALSKAKKTSYIDEWYYNYIISLSGLGFKIRTNSFIKRVRGLSGLIKIYSDNNFDYKDISKFFVKDFIRDFISLYYTHNLSNDEIKKLQKNALDSFDFYAYNYNFIYKILLFLYLSKLYLFIKMTTFFLAHFDKYKKLKNYKIKR